MNIETIMYIVGAVLSSTVVAAFFTYRVAKDKQPIERDSAVVAGAEQNVQMSILLAQHAVTRVDALSGEVKTLRLQVNESEREIRYMKRVIERWVAWGEHLRTNWPELRQQETPPLLPEMPIKEQS